MKIIYFLFLAISLVGCATVPHYTKPGATMQDFLRDRYACLQETQQRQESAGVNKYAGNYKSTVMPSCSAFGACLAAKGYLQSETGDLIVPKGSQVNCMP